MAIADRFGIDGLADVREIVEAIGKKRN